MSYCRCASHAGSWFSDDAATLARQLDGWLDASGQKPDPSVRAVIAPHAGYSYSGPTAAFAYASIAPETIQRVYLLGPSHHVYLESCGLSQASELATPLGNLPVDTSEVRALAAQSSSLFRYVAQDVDEEEHSLEMHMPILARVFQRRGLRLPPTVPIMIGALSVDLERRVGALLSVKLADPGNFFIVSSDFCHFGSRFNYTLVINKSVPLHQSIEELDRRGIALIEKQDFEGFVAYLAETKNTICGRHPIATLLASIAALKDTPVSISLIHYAQSSKCASLRDSSVSYASFIVKRD